MTSSASEEYPTSKELASNVSPNEDIAGPRSSTLMLVDTAAITAAISIK